jgi:para-nitrobenzyl esterase
MSLIRLGFTLLSFVIVACSDSSGGGATAGQQQSGPQLALTYTDSPIDLPGIVADFGIDIRYGEAERNLLDIYLPESDEPTPLVIYFHGGAYVQGDKSTVYDDFPDDIRAFLQAGIAFATVNYPFIIIEPPYDEEGVIKSLVHSARALQFLRYHAKSLNIDPQQVAAYGVSAGASTSLWLGTHDDLGDPDNPDPVLRESTRLKAVGALYTQGTLNFLRWEEILAPVIDPLVASGTFQAGDILTVASSLGAGPLLFGATGSDSVAELQSEEKRPYMENLDSIANMDASDAPVWALNDTSLFTGDAEFAGTVNLFLHHSLHVIALDDRAQVVGLENVMYAIDPLYSLEDPSGEDRVSFLIRHIQ